MLEVVIQRNETNGAKVGVCVCMWERLESHREREGKRDRYKDKEKEKEGGKKGGEEGGSK